MRRVLASVTVLVAAFASPWANAEQPSYPEQMVQKGAEAETRQAWQEAENYYRAAINAGIADPTTEVWAYYNLGRMIRNGSGTRSQRLNEILTAYCQVIRLDAMRKLGSSAVQRALDAIREEQPVGAVLILQGSASKSYRVWRIAHEHATELSNGDLPGVVLDPSAASYLISATSGDGQQVVWKQVSVTANTARRLDLDTETEPSCCLHVRTDPAYATAVLELQVGGIRLPVTGGSVACPTGRHNLVVTDGEKRSVSVTVDFGLPGDVIWLRTVRLGPTRA